VLQANGLAPSSESAGKDALSELASSMSGVQPKLKDVSSKPTHNTGVTFGKTNKRKAPKDLSEDKEAGASERKMTKKKPKKAEKKLLSFGDDA
jgi:hypothetical protein